MGASTTSPLYASSVRVEGAGGAVRRGGAKRARHEKEEGQGKAQRRLRWDPEEDAVRPAESGLQSDGGFFRREGGAALP